MNLRIVLILLALLRAFAPTGECADPLPSWNNTAPKNAIIAFVEKVTREGSPEFVPVAERIATFDNDGTLWVEQPIYVQVQFARDRLRSLAPSHPEWKPELPIKHLLEGDMGAFLAGGRKAMRTVMAAAYADTTTEEFSALVRRWMGAARHPTTGRLYTQMVYRPMLELLAYLRANGFKIFLVSGGDAEFMRPWAETIYGIPPEQVIGNSEKLKMGRRNGQPVIEYAGETTLTDDEEGKPIRIHKQIGRRPLAAFGNSDGDLPMLEWTMAGSGARFALIVHHDDAAREWAYDWWSRVGRLNKAKKEAKARGWTVVSMKNDWRTVFPDSIGQ